MIRLPGSYVQDILERTNALAEKCHPRLPGSEGCRRAALDLRDALAASCDQAFLEEYIQRPDSFFLMNKIVPVSYLAGLFFFFVGGWAVYASAAVWTLGTVYFFNEFAVLGRLFDRLFKSRPGANVIGVMEPGSDVRQQVIICSHHDSTPVCNFLEKRQWAYAFRIVLPMIVYLLANAGAILASAGLRTGSGGSPAWSIFKIVILAVTLFVVPSSGIMGGPPRPAPGTTSLPA
jgi:aminopeptidase YwaD